MTKRKRTRLVGAYRESPAPPIDLPFPVANLRALLAEGVRPDARYTHQQIKNWADRFWWTQFEQPDFLGIDVPLDIERAADLAQDVQMQWDLYVANTYTLPELQHLDFSQVRLPLEWFAGWLAQLDRLAPPTVSE